jgi:hypothetical protein
MTHETCVEGFERQCVRPRRPLGGAPPSLARDGRATEFAPRRSSSPPPRSHLRSIAPPCSRSSPRPLRRPAESCFSVHQPPLVSWPPHASAKVFHLASSALAGVPVVYTALGHDARPQDFFFWGWGGFFFFGGKVNARLQRTISQVSANGTVTRFLLAKPGSQVTRQLGSSCILLSVDLHAGQGHGEIGVSSTFGPCWHPSGASM